LRRRGASWRSRGVAGLPKFLREIEYLTLDDRLDSELDPLRLGLLGLCARRVPAPDQRTDDSRILEHVMTLFVLHSRPRLRWPRRLSSRATLFEPLFAM